MAPSARNRQRRVVGEEGNRVFRIDRREHAGFPHNAEHPEDGKHDKPDAHHRPEQRADATGALSLDREQPDEDGDRVGTTYGCNPGRHHFEALDGRQHGDRRRDHAVAVEHRRAKDAEADQPPAPPGLPLQAARNERGQREHAALAVIVGAQHQRHVLDRHDDDQRPEDHRQHAQHVGGRQRERVRTVERLAQRIQRAGTDVAVDDANGADHQRGHPLLGQGGIAHETCGD